MYTEAMQETTFEKEKERRLLGHECIIGIDEVGRGPLAGPVVAAAAYYKNSSFVIPENLEKEFSLIRDSKTLSNKQREKIFEMIKECFHVGIGIVNAETIDRVNILQASFLAMKGAIASLRKQLTMNDEQGTKESLYCLIDGNQLIPNCSYPQECVIGGDGIVKSIAAASIIAKVTRDRMMDKFDREYPGYGFADHKGYGTKEHLDALRRIGPCPIHRKTFRPVLLSDPENVNIRFSNVLKPRKR